MLHFEMLMAGPAISAVTVQQVNEALRKHVDPAAINIVKGGDFQKASVYQ